MVVFRPEICLTTHKDEWYPIRLILQYEGAIEMFLLMKFSNYV